MLLLHRVSSLFPTIRFSDWLDIDAINQGVSSSKPVVELYMSDRSTAEFKILAACLPGSRINRIHLEGITDRKVELLCSALVKKPSSILTDWEMYGKKPT